MPPTPTKVRYGANASVLSKTVLPTLIKINSPCRKKNKDSHFYTYNNTA